MTGNYCFAPRNAPRVLEFYGGHSCAARGPEIFFVSGSAQHGITLRWESDMRSTVRVLREHLGDPCVLDPHGLPLTGAQTLELLRVIATREFLDEAPKA